GAVKQRAGADDTPRRAPAREEVAEQPRRRPAPPPPDEDDRPRRRRDEEDDRPRSRRRDEDEDDRPARSRRDEEDDRPRSRRDRDDEEDDDRPRRRRQEKKGGAGLMSGLIAGGVLGLVGAAGGGDFLVSGGKKKDDGKGGGGVAKTYDSPQAVFDAAKDAAKNKDFRTFTHCLTTESQEVFAGMMAFQAALMISFTEAFAKGDKAGEAMKKLQPLMHVLDRHGLTKAERDKIAKTKPKGGGNPKDMFAGMKEMAAPVKDKPAFVGELMDALIKLNPKSANELAAI